MNTGHCLVVLTCNKMGFDLLNFKLKKKTFHFISFSGLSKEYNLLTYMFSLDSEKYFALCMLGYFSSYFLLLSANIFQK